MDYSVAEKEAVHEAFEQALDQLDARDRALDRWEEHCLAQAIAAMTCGKYRLAAVFATNAAIPLPDRHERLSAGLEATPSLLSTEDFRSGLAALRRMPSEQPLRESSHPHG